MGLFALLGFSGMLQFCGPFSSPPPPFPSIFPTNIGKKYNRFQHPMQGHIYNIYIA